VCGQYFNQSIKTNKPTNEKIKLELEKEKLGVNAKNILSKKK
jgi:hypothetical protein